MVRILKQYINISIFITFLFFPQNSFSISKDGIKFTVNEKEIYFEKSQKPIKNIVIRNLVNQPLYFTTSVKKITNDDFEIPTLEDSKEIIITPKNIKIEPKKTFSMRAIYLPSSTNKESLFQINIIPTTENFKDKFEEKTFAIGVIVDPLYITDDLKYTKQDSVIIFQNKGNRSVFIQNAKSCEGNECKKINDVRIPQKSELRLNIDKGASFSCIKKIGNEFEKLTIK